jgi:hypothetical protein
MIIIENKIRCKHCGDVIESLHQHHFVECSCGRCALSAKTKRLIVKGQASIEETVIIGKTKDGKKYNPKKIIVPKPNAPLISDIVRQQRLERLEKITGLKAEKLGFEK